MAGESPVSLPTLVIGNCNYSSWSLRAWLALEQTGISFREQVIWPDLLQDGAKLLAFTFGFLSIAYHRFRIRQEI